MHLPGIAGEKTDAEGTDLIYEGITTSVLRTTGTPVLLTR
jgi:hypothetical protein